MKSKAELHGCYSTYLQSRWYQRSKTRKFPENMRAAITAVIPIGSTVIDIGSTIGWMTARLKEIGYDIVGIDGSDGVEQLSGGLVKQVDLVSDDCSHLFGKFQWGLFLDVGEHIPKEYEQIAVDNVAKMPTEGLLVSWNSWNTDREDHVNLRDEPYVVKLFEDRGWKLDEDKTKTYRTLMGPRPARRRAPLVFGRSR